MTSARSTGLITESPESVQQGHQLPEGTVTHLYREGRLEQPHNVPGITPISQIALGERFMVSKEHLLHVVRDVDPDATLDDEAGELLMLMANEFIEGVIDGSGRLAKHRNAQAIESADVALFLEKQWQMKIPGFSEQATQGTTRAPAARK